MAKSFASLANKATSKTSTTDVYQVDGSDNPIVMALEIGAPGQTSLTRVKIGSVTLAKDVEGEIHDLEVGTNKSANGRFLNVKAIVTDMQDGTNDTFVRFSLMGGPTGKYSCELSKTVAEDRDSVFYEIEIFFFT